MSVNQEFGALEMVDLREGWSTEAGDFTPWLGDRKNLDLLGRTLGMALEPLHQEHPVGPFRADLVCRDADTDELVLIENQLERTDHSHLGQLLTYAAGLEAFKAIWIARRFREEHRAAIDWLNNHTSDDVQLFGLELELWSISGSLPAPKFNIVAKPNVWIKAGVGGLKSGVSQARLGYMDYWTAFKSYVEDKELELQDSIRPHPANWMSYRPFGVSNIVVAAVLGAHKRLRAEVFLKSATAKPYFDWLHERKDSIQNAAGCEFIWERLDDKMASRIKVELQSESWTDPDERVRQFSWLVDQLSMLESAFAPFVREAAGDLSEDDDDS